MKIKYKFSWSDNIIGSFVKRNLGIIIAVSYTHLNDMRYSSNTFCHVPENTWTFLGATLNGGVALKWLRDNISVSYTHLNILVSLFLTTPDNAFTEEEKEICLQRLKEAAIYIEETAFGYGVETQFILDWSEENSQDLCMEKTVDFSISDDSDFCLLYTSCNRS